MYTRLPPPVDTEMRTAGEGEVEMPTANETMLTMFPRDEIVAGSDAEMEEAPAPTPLAVEMADQSEESTMLTNFPQDELLMEQEERAASPSLPAVDMEESPEGGELVEMSREEIYTQPALDGPAEPASAEQPAIAEDWSKLPLQYQPDQVGDQLMLPAWRDSRLGFGTDTEGEAYVSVPASSADEMEAEHYDPRTENIVELAGESARSERGRTMFRPMIMPPAGRQKSQKRGRADRESSEESARQVVKFKGPRVNQVGESWRDRETQGALQVELGFVRKCKELFKTKGINCFPAKSK